MEQVSVLVVDDEPGMRLGARRALASFSFLDEEAGEDVGFIIEEADCGERALEILKSASPPEIVLLDHKLPGISGIEVMEQLPSTSADSLIIMMTAYASIETAVQATKRGAYDFLAKPFTPEELRYTVKKAAGRVMLLRKARRLEAERRRIRFDFIRVLGHELKAPLGAVESYLGLMQRRTVGEDFKAYDKMIDSSVKRLEQMRRLIADLLDMTRIESGQMPRNVEELNLYEVATQSIELLKPLALERKVTVELQGAEILPFTGDRAELDMIFNNLISNAIKYNREEGSVAVDLLLEESSAVIRVKDTGIGMSEQEVGKLFREFSRIKNEKTQGILGTGLGLSIIKRLVEQNSGSIRVESEPDVGTEFIVVL